MSKSEQFAGKFAPHKFTGVDGTSKEEFFERAVKLESGIQLYLSDLVMPSHEDMTRLALDPDVDSLELQRGNHPMLKKRGWEENWRYFRVGDREEFEENSELEFKWEVEPEDRPNYLEDTPLVETIFSDVFEDLKYKNQHGPWALKKPVYPEDRYEHSIGVMNMLRRHGASVDEQLAGLLHDIGHGPMSHWAEEVDSKLSEAKSNHELHEDLLEERLKDSELAQEFEKFNSISLGQVIEDYKNDRFGLLEASKPDICGDRWDYFIREALVYGAFSDAEETFGPIDDHPGSNEYPEWDPREDIARWNDAVEAYSETYDGSKHETFKLEARQEDSRFVMNDPVVAAEAARAFIDMSRGFWWNTAHRAQSEAYAGLAAEAIEETEVSQTEFFEMTDQEAVGMMRNYDAETLEAIDEYFVQDNIQIVDEEDDWDMRLDGYEWEGEVDPQEGTGYHKSIDPLVKTDGEFKRASEYEQNEGLKESIEQHEEWAAEDKYVKVDGFDFNRISDYL
ncbi:MAG: HD domain-containing protein [Candidatus Nanosalina sp.]